MCVCVNKILNKISENKNQSTESTDISQRKQS